jgi:hypothetical protein
MAHNSGGSAFQSGVGVETQSRFSVEDRAYASTLVSLGSVAPRFIVSGPSKNGRGREMEDLFTYGQFTGKQ